MTRPVGVGDWVKYKARPDGPFEEVTAVDTNCFWVARRWDAIDKADILESRPKEEK